MKYRGQWSIVGLILFVLMLIIGLALVPTIGTSTNNAFANATLFPTDGPAYLVGRLLPFMFIVMLVIGGFMMMQRGPSQEQG